MQIKRRPSAPDQTHGRIYLGRGLYTLVSPADLPWLTRFVWTLRQSAHCIYVTRKCYIAGKQHTVRMHREIANTPPGFQCHHKNLDPLDNRRENLQNVTPSHHRTLHNKTR